MAKLFRKPLTRRRLLSNASLTAMAAGLPSWLAEPLVARAQAPVIRRDVNSSDPAALNAVDAYREAIGIMQARSPHDPTGWLFQADIHAWPGQFGVVSQDPQQEFQDVFPPGGIPGLDPAENTRLEALARMVWGTCPHGPPSFLPWHRIYIFLFEKIVQKTLGDPTWGLPYWNWTKDRTLPLAFREEVDGSQQGNELFWEVRNQGVNAIDPAGQLAELEPVEVGIGFLSDQRFDTRLFGGFFPFGFSPSLERGPHGNVHVFVGPDEGMGFFEQAARDPIFWCHHCNIDRLWESWVQTAGHENPEDVMEWADEQHTFADDDGQERRLTTQQVLIAAVILGAGYEYDRLEEVMEPAVALAASSSSDSGGGPSPPESAAAAGVDVVAASGAVRLASGTARVELSPPEGQPSALAEAGDDEHLVLTLNGLMASRSPRDNFAVYLNLPPDTAPDPQGPHFVGTVNFFNAVGPQRGVSGMAAAEHHPAADQLFDVTDVLRRQRERGLWQGDAVISVTIVPIRGNVDPAALPTISSINLVRR